ncbi:activator-dependent family glycosyltransferase [Sinosporangium siamense]|uniref:Glycosyl transferase n=1 Tax=Sinosporangium siamense TaxID=1367973 RepID=A0A919V5C0_9ACTN|nr:activator-dependent family glycosyltransferase [Sinosporangium siamense]GII90691.1 glycosyl transferase [Sinosporangium siamense]
MRILFATYAEKSHFLVMVPLAWALQNAGHEVRVASQPELTDVIVRSGLTAVPVGKNHDMYRVNRAFKFFDPRAEVSRFDMSGTTWEQVGWEHLRLGYQGYVRWWPWLVNRGLVGDLTDFCRHWQPDLVIWEPLTYSGAIAAKASGAAHARLMWSVDLFSRLREEFMAARDRQPGPVLEDPLAEWMDARARTVGVEFSEDMAHGQFIIDHNPPSMSLGLDLPYVPTRYVPYNDVATVPRWLRAEPERPRICLTLGTTATERFEGYAVSVQDLLDSLSDLDVEVVATLSEQAQAKLRHVPGNTRVVSFAPLHVLAPTCAAMINHGGNGTFYTTLINGVPQLVIPTMFDEPVRAKRLAEEGAGLTLQPAEVTGEKIRACVERLLGEPSFAEHSARLRAEMLAMPSPNDVVPQIEELTARHRPATALTGR